VLDGCLPSSEDLGFLDLFDETAGAHGKSMDLELSLEHLGVYQPALRPGGRCRTVGSGSSQQQQRRVACGHSYCVPRMHG
jgi:hypothetical protein